MQMPIYHFSLSLSAFRVAQLVKNKLEMQETPVQFLGEEVPPEKR